MPKRKELKMSRPTNDPKYYRINLRVNEETDKMLRKLSENNGITIAEYVRGLINGIKNPGTVNNSNPLLKLSEELHIPYETFCSEIIRLTDSGELMEERGSMVVHESGLYISEYLSVCKDIGKDAQKCLDGFTESLRKGNRIT